ncbi:hypothetical protein B566_EDAN010411 [Ephemera danica]|nr:hypothetical protein B566_EDAN010411 [Ephemera danica]
MSNSHLFMLAGYPKVPLKNGIGRYICQLQRVTLKFCKSNGSSRGVRDFIESHLVDFARRNPGVAFYLKPRRHRNPCIVAEYLNGERQYLSCRDFNGLDVAQWLNVYLKMSGYPETRMISMSHTDHPSIQGVWTPFTNKDPSTNTKDVFDKELSGPLHLPPSATQQLIEIFNQQQKELMASKHEVLNEVQAQ